VKHLPKHLRPRWRYFAVGIETWPDADLGRRGFQRALWYAAGNLLGDAGSADADLTLLSFSHDGGEGEAIVRARHGHVDDARATIACVSEVDDEPVGSAFAGFRGRYVPVRKDIWAARAVVRHSETSRSRGAERSAVVREDAYDVWTGSAYVGAAAFDTE